MNQREQGQLSDEAVEALSENTQEKVRSGCHIKFFIDNIINSLDKHLSLIGQKL
jgi:hypothetical protein